MVVYIYNDYYYYHYIVTRTSVVCRMFASEIHLLLLLYYFVLFMHLYMYLSMDPHTFFQTTEKEEHLVEKYESFISRPTIIKCVCVCACAAAFIKCVYVDLSINWVLLDLIMFSLITFHLNQHTNCTERIKLCFSRLDPYTHCARIIHDEIFI